MLGEIFKKKDNQFMLALIVISLFFVFFGFYLLNDKNLEIPKEIPNSVEEIKWNEFKNKKFNFTIDYPSHFEIFEGEIESSPVFNIYYRTFDADFPLSYTSNQSHFSIYPLGLPFGGANLTYVENKFENSNGLKFKTKEFKTLKNEVWGVMYVPDITPKGWNETGFIWISSRLKDLEYECLSGDLKKDPAICNIYEGDQIFKIGEIDTELLNISREILNKIKFN